MPRSGFVVHHDQADRPVYTTDLSHGRCEAFWSAVRRYHVNVNGWSDIAYSFGVCRHGVPFVGRGWFRSQFAGGADQIPDDLAYSDAHWYSVLCFLGGPEHPTAEMLSGLASLIAEGRAAGYCGLRVIPHNRFRRKPCPGPALTAWCELADGNPTLPTSLEEPVTPEQIAAIVNGVNQHTLALHHLENNYRADIMQRTIAAIQQLLLDAEVRQNAAILAGIANILDSWTPEQVEVAITTLPDAWLKAIGDAVNDEAARRLGFAS